MAPKVLEINSLLDTLQDEDYNTVISFIKFLSNSREKEKAEKSVDISTDIWRAGWKITFTAVFVRT